MKIKSLAVVSIMALMLTACGNADSTSTHIPSDVSTTTTTTSVTTTTAEPTTTGETAPSTLSGVTTEVGKETSASESVTTPSTTTMTQSSTGSVTTTTTKKPVETEIEVVPFSATMYANKTANVRKGNSTDYDIVATVKVNTKITIVGKCSNGWYKVNVSGKTGYMANSVLSDSTVTTTTTVTTKKPTTTTTTTAKPVDSDEYALTGIMESYYRLCIGLPTEEDERLVIEDLCNYTMEKYNGKSGTFTYDEGGPFIVEALTGLGKTQYLDRTNKTHTFSVGKPFTLIINRKANFDNGARTNTQYDNEISYIFSRELSAKEKYYYVLSFRSKLYGLCDRGIEVSLAWYGEDSLTRGYEADKVFDFYFCIDHTATPLINSSKPNEVIYVWYLCPTELYSDYYPDYEYAE